MSSEFGGTIVVANPFRVTLTTCLSSKEQIGPLLIARYESAYRDRRLEDLSHVSNLWWSLRAEHSPTIDFVSFLTKCNSVYYPWFEVPSRPGPFGEPPHRNNGCSWIGAPETLPSTLCQHACLSFWRRERLPIRCEAPYRITPPHDSIRLIHLQRRGAYLCFTLLFIVFTPDSGASGINVLDH